MCPDGFVKTGSTKDLFNFECVKCDESNVSVYVFNQVMINLNV